MDTLDQMFYDAIKDKVLNIIKEESNKQYSEEDIKLMVEVFRAGVRDGYKFYKQMNPKA